MVTKFTTNFIANIKLPKKHSLNIWICLITICIDHSKKLCKIKRVCDEKTNKKATLDGKLYGSMVCCPNDLVDVLADDLADDAADDDDCDDDDDNDDYDANIGSDDASVLPPMFCKSELLEGGNPSNSDECKFEASKFPTELSESDLQDNGNFWTTNVNQFGQYNKRNSPIFHIDVKLDDDQTENTGLKRWENNIENLQPQVHHKLTKDTLKLHMALNEISNQQKRFRASSSSSSTSTSSTTSSSSTNSPRSKKSKLMKRIRCPKVNANSNVFFFILKEK